MSRTTRLAWKLRRSGFRHVGRDGHRGTTLRRHYYDRGSVRVVLDAPPMRSVIVSRERGHRWYAILNDPPDRVVLDLVKLARRSLPPQR